MRLFCKSRYETIFLPLRGRRVGYVQGMFGNAGDALIHYGTLQLFADFGIDYEIVNPGPMWDGSVAKRVDELVLFGGGSMGYPASGRPRACARRWRGPTTLLPQSWRSAEDAPYDRVFARERYSLSMCAAAVLQPDLGLAFDYTSPVPEPTSQIGIWMREDGERLFSTGGNDPAQGLGRLDAIAYLALAASQRVIITDRLHFAICGLLNRRRTILLPNAYFKNRGVWEAWLQDLNCEWAESIPEAMEAL